MRESQDTPALENHRQNLDLHIETPLSEPAPATPVLELRKITKRFGSIQALSDASLVLGAGEVHALLGENGAGKSTMIKIMTGVHQPDSGDNCVSRRSLYLHDTACRSNAAACHHGHPPSPERSRRARQPCEPYFGR